MKDRRVTGLNKERGPWLAGAVVTVLIAGVFFAWWMIARADREMRAELLRQTRLVSLAVNVQDVQALSGTEADLDNPAYRQLKELLSSLRSADPKCRFVYLLGRKADGRIFFFVDSEPADSKDCSPPGQVYEEAPAGYRRMFDTKAEVVEGPVTDRWGMWVSALVPLTDPGTGVVLSVLGMDIDARTWRWEVGARAATPVGVMLVLFIGLAAAFISTRRVKASPRPVLRRLLPPFAMVVMVVMLGAGALLWQEHRQQLVATIADRSSRVSSGFRVALDQQVVGLVETAQSVAADADVRSALREGDADRLLAAWRPVFETLRQEHRLTHFSFFDKDLVCLLHVHMPRIRVGERNERFTALEAERTGRTASGIELGTLGTFTLRVVQPVFEGGRRIGYVELSREVTDVVRSLPIPSGTQLAVVIRKASLNEQARKAGMLTRDACRSCHRREVDWDRLPRSVVVYSSQGRLPDAFATWADHLAGEHLHGETDRDIVSGGMDWRVSATPLNDASGQEIGDLLFMSDITADKAAFARLLALGGTGAAVLLALLLGFIYVLLRRTDAGIRAQEAALREGEALMRAITDSAQDAILMMDVSGHISYWNPAAERIFGYARAEALGKNLHQLIAPQRYHEAHLAAFARFQRTGQGNAIGTTLELEACHKNGHEISVGLSLSAIQLQGGWHTVGIVRDITEHKQAEAILHRTNRDLQEATTRANDMAERAELASAAKSEFLANMSHEIRTPMNGVIGMTGLLLDTGLDDEQRRYAEIVRASGESLLGLINDILDFSKIEAKKLDLETLDFDLLSLLDDFAATLAVRAHDKGLELLCAADPAVPTLLRGDPGRLRQILTNLAGNAVKFTPAGEVAVRVSLVEESENDVLLRFSVRDTGIGIAEDKIGLLFDKFSQVDTSTTRRYGGTGLGLAISKQLADLMGGDSGVESKEGKGSEFWFTARLGKQVGGVQADSTPPADLRRVRALIVDDNGTSREILTTWLASWGMRPSEVQDGPGALQALHRALEENDPFRIAVIDMQMPGMDGETLGRTIQADECLAETRMVMLTSLGMRGDARRFQEIGFAAYATKPIRHQELKAVLSLALTHRDGAEVAPRPIATRHMARETLNLFAGRKARILLAEDNITNQQVALGILKKLGLRADAVANGAEALKALKTLPYDLVLMDVQMPEMDGIEATRRIRDPRFTIPNRRIPIIAMTARAMQGDRERCLEAGMDDYVAKPVSPRSLAEVLDKWLPQGSAATTGQAPVAPEGTASVPAQEPEALVFDRAGMMTRVMEDEGLANEIVAAFLEDIPQQIAALRRFLEAGDAQGAGRQAHAIKGASATVGGERLRAVASEMEKAGQAGDLTAVAGHLAELDAQFDRLKQAMTKEL
jgi:two-component system sensor histidine kinase/response regulator